VKLLGKVEAVFWISGRGVVISPVGLSDLGLHNGDSIELRAPDGRVRNTQIAAVESANQGPGKPRRPVFMLSRDVAKEDIVDGMEIWI